MGFDAVLVRDTVTRRSLAGRFYVKHCGQARTGAGQRVWSSGASAIREV